MSGSLERAPSSVPLLDGSSSLLLLPNDSLASASVLSATAAPLYTLPPSAAAILKGNNGNRYFPPGQHSSSTSSFPSAGAAAAGIVSGGRGGPWRGPSVMSSRSAFSPEATPNMSFASARSGSHGAHSIADYHYGRRRSVAEAAGALAAVHIIGSDGRVESTPRRDGDPSASVRGSPQPQGGHQRHPPHARQLAMDVEQADRHEEGRVVSASVASSGVDAGLPPPLSSRQASRSVANTNAHSKGLQGSRRPPAGAGLPSSAALGQRRPLVGGAEARRGEGLAAAPAPSGPAGRSRREHEGLVINVWDARSALGDCHTCVVPPGSKYMAEVLVRAAELCHCKPAPTCLRTPRGSRVSTIEALQHRGEYLVLPSGCQYREDTVPVALLHKLVAARDRLLDRMEAAKDDG